MSLAARARKLWLSEGPMGLSSGLVRLVRTALRHLYFRADFFVHEFDLSLLPVEYPFAIMEEVEIHVVESDADARRLVCSGYEDFRQVVPLSGYRLGNGAVGFCAYIDRHVAHTGWIGLTERAKRSFDPLPYRVDFDCGEGVSGGSWTFPAYRGRGIYRYVMWHRLWYLREHTCTVCLNATEVGNTAGIRGQVVFPSHIVGTLRVSRILGIEHSRLESVP